MINQETIDKIYDVADVVEVVSDFVHLKKRGVNYIGLCPFHNEKTPSFTVSPSKGIYKCFGCGKGGNSVNFIMEHEQLSYAESLRFLAKKYHIEIVEEEISEEEKEQKDARESMMIVNAFAQKIFIKNLHETEEGKAVGLSYFKERGFTDKSIKKFELGYCRATRDHFSTLALQNGYQLKYLVSTGLSIQRDDGTPFDRFSERVMFPIHNLMGRVIAFGGRTLRGDKKVAKYLNSPESEIYHKSKIVYGIYFAKNSIVKNDKCYLVEGYTDVISMHQAGIENVVASSGTALTVDQIRLIKRFTQNITVLYDGDAAGIKAALRGIDLVLEEGMNVKVVLLPDGEDPDSYARKHHAAEFYDFISENETDFIAFKTKLLLDESAGDPVKKANLINDIVRTISVIPDSITRSVYIKECSKMLDTDEKILSVEVNKIIYRNQEQRLKHEQPAIKNPSGEALNLQIQDTDKFERFEEEIVRLLLLYGEKILFTIAPSDELPEQEINAATYIIRELENEITFQTPVYQLVFRDYKRMFNQGQLPSGTYFTQHQNQLISQTAAHLLSGDHPLSKIWSKKGTYINTEEDDLKEVIDRAINGYKYELVMNILLEIEKGIKGVQDDESLSHELKELLDRYMVYTQFKIEISKVLGERIILKR